MSAYSHRNVSVNHEKDCFSEHKLKLRLLVGRSIQVIPAVALVFLSSICFGQSYRKTPYGVQAKVGDASVVLSFYGPKTIRVIKTPGTDTLKDLSLSVVQRPTPLKFSVKQLAQVLTLKSDSMMVSMDLGTGTLSYFSRTGALLLKEKDNSTKFTRFNDAGVNTWSVAQSFVLENDEPIYGLGQHQRGVLNQRNQVYNRMIQNNTDDVVPFFQSVKGYGVFWDNYSPTTFSDQNGVTSFTSEVGSGANYYFMVGNNADGVIGQMRALTGVAPMFPLWTFGFWQSKERYKSQDELVGVVRKYRELQVPLDGIIQDWQYWGSNYLWNAMDFLNPDYGNPKKMVDDVHQLNAHMIISIWSSFGPNTKPFKEMSEKNMLFNITTWPESGSDKWPPNMDYPSGVKVYDAYNPEARDIYWKYANKGLFSIGIDGWWMDSTEPDHLRGKPADLDTKTYLGSFRKVRNAYPLMTVGGVADHQLGTSSDKRVFILTRSAFAGQQRYGANTWSGDITASWQTLRQQVPTGLNFSLSGIPYWNSDIGGFFLSNFRRKLTDPEYRELYTRWIEFGAFCPMMRSHGADAPREIYQFGKKGDKVYDAIEKFIKIRYQLLPYIYSTSWDVTHHNGSIMRALMMDFASDKATWSIGNQYMFGKSLLINPVVQPMYVKAGTVNGKDTLKTEDFGQVKSQKTYLPKGTDWYDFWTGEKFTGGQTVSKETPIDVIPAYVKAGSVLPLGPQVQYATEKKWDNLDLRIYAGADGHFTLYEDENDNYNYQKGKYSEIRFYWDNRKRVLKIENRVGAFNGMIKQRVFNISTFGLSANKAATGTSKSIAYNGKALEVSF